MFSGQKGIGKSTLLLQLSLSLDKKVLYVSGEESLQQIKLRADRMGLSTDSCFLLSQTDTHKIFGQLTQLNPHLLIIDSIQTLHTPHIESGAGSVSQIKATAAELIHYAKTTNTPVVLVGHITKDGGIAGPKILEHMANAFIAWNCNWSVFLVRKGSRVLTGLCPGTLNRMEQLNNLFDEEMKVLVVFLLNQV